MSADVGSAPVVDAPASVLLCELLYRAAAHWAVHAAAAAALLAASWAALGWPLWPRRSLAGKVVVVTGAGSGLGRELARAFARQGARLVLWDVDAGGMEGTAALLPAGAVLARAVVDVARRERVHAAAAEAMSAAGDGGVYCLVNNAGLVGGKPLLGADDDRIAKVFEVNTLALFWTSRAFLPGMLQRGGGAVVTVASGAALVGVANNADYSASKHAARGFTASLRQELKKHGHWGVRTLTVYPGIIDTPLAAGYRLPGVPAMTAAYVAGEVVDAVRTGRAELYLPLATLLGQYNVALLPCGMFDWVSRAFGASDVADQWDATHSDAVYSRLRGDAPADSPARVQHHPPRQ